MGVTSLYLSLNKWFVLFRVTPVHLGFQPPVFHASNEEEVARGVRFPLVVRGGIEMFLVDLLNVLDSSLSRRGLQHVAVCAQKEGT